MNVGRDRKRQVDRETEEGGDRQLEGRGGRGWGWSTDREGKTRPEVLEGRNPGSVGGPTPAFVPQDPFGPLPNPTLYNLPRSRPALSLDVCRDE